MRELYLSFFFAYTIFAIVNPYLQIILRNCGYSYQTIGILLALFEGAGILGPLVMGSLADKTQRFKDTILVSTAMTALGFILVTQGTSQWIVVSGLLVSAFFLRSIIPIQDTVATSLFEGDAKKYTKVRAFGTLGFVLFSLFYAAIKKPVLSDNASILRYILFGCVLFFLPVLAWKEKKRPKRKAKKVVVEPKRKKGAFYDSAFVVGLIIIALNRLSMSTVSSFLSLYMVEELHIEALTLVNALAASSEIVAMLIAGRLLQSNKVKPVTLLMISALGMVARLVIYAMVPSIFGIISGQLLHSLGYGVFHPAAVQFVFRRVKKSHRATGMAMYISLGTGLPAMLGSTFGGYVTQFYGYKVLFLSFSFFAALSALLCIIFRQLFSKPPIGEA
ncbi:arabinose efflux permease family protein [Sphaerochaeta pleomorpha str. Grapes]|uniref:Arabinose efflux permease family protein n=1 Tax=Sphaerochaeta pleomorpha (strain ATCC BAA-1885 / DSM 22778 / Grapes) TaxID=158190 RepID=G8QXN9_SPHPG|nr:MFS transporter [Sphaerochaeta pleomorpha]AEV30683.1 arabinose efflux permease family protein [Sphaerochaeta pleomorpha str. Grapes]